MGCSLRWIWLGLVFAAPTMTAADLPITQVIIDPHGALVEREGTLPAGDEVLANVPADIDLGQVQLAIDGIATPPALHLDLPPTAVLPPPDPAWVVREASARATFEACQPAIELADLRLRLARAVLSLLPTPSPASSRTLPLSAAPTAPAAPPPTASTLAARPPGSDLPLPATADQQALVAFVASNLARAQADRLAAAQTRLAAQHALEILGLERERQRPPQQLGASLRLPGAAGHRVHLRYRVDDAAWAPVYRVELHQGTVTLVSEALVDVPRDQHWETGRLVLETRPPEASLHLQELTIPVLELGNEVVVEREQDGGSLRVIGRYGASRGSESMTDAALHHCQRDMDPSGCWLDGPWTLHATAATVLAFLGAGYDHQTPNKYRRTLLASLGWLRQQPVPSDLLGAALQLSALSEATAMTNDTDLKQTAGQLLTALAARVVNDHELDAEIFRTAPDAGPVCLAWVELAVKSAVAAGLDPTSIAALQATIQDLLPQLVGHADEDAAAITRLCVQEWQGLHAEALPPPPLSAWLEHVDGWLTQGRPELLHLATLGLFQYGGSSWTLWNREVHDRLRKLAETGQRNGYRAVTPDPMGDAWTRAILTLPQEIYYRYAPVRTQAMASGGASDAPDNALQPLPPVTALAHDWPVRIDVGVQPLVDGHRSRVVLRRTVLPGPVRLRAAPADAEGAWRVFACTNPLAAPLLEGPIDVVVDGETVGQGQLPFTEPGAPLTLELGRDDRVLVHRSESHHDDEAWGKRTRTTTLQFTVEAPPGLYPSVRIDEAMPVPTEASIQLLAVNPPIAPLDLDRRLVEDPFWHLDLDLHAPQAQATITYQLRYPATVEPEPRSTPPTPPAAPEHTP